MPWRALAAPLLLDGRRVVAAPRRLPPPAFEDGRGRAQDGAAPPLARRRAAARGAAARTRARRRRRERRGARGRGWRRAARGPLRVVVGRAARRGRCERGAARVLRRAPREQHPGGGGLHRRPRRLHLSVPAPRVAPARLAARHVCAVLRPDARRARPRRTARGRAALRRAHARGARRARRRPDPPPLAPRRGHRLVRRLPARQGVADAARHPLAGAEDVPRVPRPDQAARRAGVLPLALPRLRGALLQRGARLVPRLPPPAAARPRPPRSPLGGVARRLRLVAAGRRARLQGRGLLDQQRRAGAGALPRHLGGGGPRQGLLPQVERRQPRAQLADPRDEVVRRRAESRGGARAGAAAPARLGRLLGPLLRPPLGRLGPLARSPSPRPRAARHAGQRGARPAGDRAPVASVVGD
mmetsp:Transcript_14635/g.41979  ORF Transcript_14635/g.41979 Transcript_14635/m.41979 type:complete len:414 (+) Transcript_14635:804-2045(+)